MKKIITLAQSLMQEIERYDKELIEIEKVSDYRFEENEKLTKENKLLQQQIEKMKKDVEELKLGSEDVEMFLRTDELLRSWELAKLQKRKL